MTLTSSCYAQGQPVIEVQRTKAPVQVLDPLQGRHVSELRDSSERFSKHSTQRSCFTEEASNTEMKNKIVSKGMTNGGSFGAAILSPSLIAPLLVRSTSNFPWISIFKPGGRREMGCPE